MKRLGPEGFVQINIQDLSLNIQNKFWEPDWNKKYSLDNIIKCLEDLILFPSRENKNTALSLSGGLDSRTLFSIFLKNKSEYLSSHAFGDESNQDVLMAKSIANKSTFDFKMISIEENTEEKILNTIYEYIPTSGFILSLNDLLVIPSHAKLYERNEVIIDGAYGEIIRREFLNRIYFLGKDAITQKHDEKFFQLLKNHRGTFF